MCAIIDMFVWLDHCVLSGSMCVCVCDSSGVTVSMCLPISLY